VVSHRAAQVSVRPRLVAVNSRIGPGRIDLATGLTHIVPTPVPETSAPRWYHYSVAACMAGAPMVNEEPYGTQLLHQADSVELKLAVSCSVQHYTLLRILSPIESSHDRVFSSRSVHVLSPIPSVCRCAHTRTHSHTHTPTHPHIRLAAITGHNERQLLMASGHTHTHTPNPRALPINTDDAVLAAISL
jgi:hypothetical protein